MDRLTLYIDKENVKSFVQSKDKDLFDDCTRLIRKNIDIHYNFPKEDIAKDSYLQLWFRYVNGQGVGNNFEYSLCSEDIFPERPFSLKDFGPEGNEDPFAIYLLDEKQSCNKIKNHNCILIGAVGQEITTIKQLLDINEEEEEFAIEVFKKGWEKYCPKLPLTDIVLCDNYYFSNYGVYKRNNNNLIRVLSSRAKKFPINVVIITRNSEISMDINIKDELDNIKDLVVEASGNEDSSVTIIGTRNAIHDRDLITNYYRIYSTAGFQRQQHVKNDIRFEIKSHTRGKNYNTSWKLIDNTYKNAIKKSPLCIGDKRSNFIDF
jgi:hypothetical protein